jgi:peptidyl-prolyl cis-trans isomerase A (cyclophilin A)
MNSSLPLLLLVASWALSPAIAADDAATRVRMDTAAGAIVVELDPLAAPVTAAHFLALVDAGTFDGGASFYRVVRLDNQPTSPVPIEVIQGGLGSGRTEAAIEPVAHETTATTGLRHLDGVISMARTEPGTASSEFFICVNDQPELDFGGRRNPDGQGFAAFGRVVDGMDVVRAIQAAATAPPPEGGDDFSGQQLAQPVAIDRVVRLHHD